VKPDKASIIGREVGTAVVRWREAPAATDIAPQQLERIATEFEHEE
jgi:hypothetical protein